MDRVKDRFLDDKMEMLSSLLASVQEAGGTVSSFNWKHIKNMEVRDIFDKLATNKVRFHHERESNGD